MGSHCIIEEDVQDKVPIMPSHTLGMLPKEPPISLIKEIKTQMSWKKHNRMKGLVFFFFCPQRIKTQPDVGKDCFFIFNHPMQVCSYMYTMMKHDYTV